MRTASLILSLVLTLVWVIVPDCGVFALSAHDPVWWHHVSYMFMHASLLHLLSNVWFLLTFAFLFRSLKWQVWICCALIALIMPSGYSEGMVGISGMLYALSGFGILYCRRKLRSVILMGILMSVQMALGHVAVIFHLKCLLAAVCIAVFFFPVLSHSQIRDSQNPSKSRNPDPSKS